MHKMTLVSLALLSASSLSFAAGENIAGVSTNSALVTVGPSIAAGPHGAAGLPGIGVYTIASGSPVGAKVLYEDLRTSFNSTTGIATIGGSAHAGMGLWSLGRVVGSDGNEVYYGVWAGPTPGGPATSTSYAAYAVADNVTRSLNTVKGNSYTYATKGVGQGSEIYTGNLTANFNAAGTGGRLTGSIASASNTISLDGAGAFIGVIGTGATAQARFQGAATGGAYAVDGRFYGANAETLAGAARHNTDASKSVGFAGAR